MQNHLVTWLAVRALQLVPLALAAAVAVVLLSATGAGAQVTISKTDTNINNTGEAEADTGNNEIVANDSEEVVTNQQTAEEIDGGVLHNASDESSESDGSATLETGSATAIGNASGTIVVQVTASGPAAEAIAAAAIGTPYGPTPTSPLVAIDEALPPGDTPDPAESTGSEEGLEVDDEGEADPEGEDPSDLEEPEAAEAAESNPSPASTLPSSGSGAIDAGAPAVPVLATPPLDNSVLGAVSGAGPPGNTITDQRSNVENLGEATATTGENTVVDGDVLTGNATAYGNISETASSQTIVALGDLNLVDQDIDVTNEGEAEADTGENVVEGGDLETGEATATGNMATTTTSQFAVAAGELNQLDQAIDIDNEGEAEADTGDNEVADGDVSTGAADAAGNISATSASQLALAAGDLNLVDQAIHADNEGEAEAETGENVVEEGEVATGDATATGNWSSSALGQRVVTPQAEDQTDVEQDLAAANEGEALADTGDNEAVAGEDGEVSIETGTAAAYGNIAALATSQEA